MMSTNTIPKSNLIDRLTRALDLVETPRVVEQVRAEVSKLARQRALDIPEAWRRPLRDHHARRLFYRDPAVRFTVGVTRDEVGASGALIPPREYHRMVNPSLTETAVTIHVYGGELDRCSAFVPCADGYHCGESRQLSYTA